MTSLLDYIAALIFYSQFMSYFVVPRLSCGTLSEHARDSSYFSECAGESYLRTVSYGMIHAA